MFEDATFESTGRIRTRSRRWMIVTFVLNGAVLTALILIPLIYPEALPQRLMISLISAPAPPAEPQTPPHPQAARVTHASVDAIPLQFTAPRQIPTGVRRELGREEIGSITGPINMDGGPGVVGSDNPFGHSTEPAVRLAPKPSGPTQISKGVAEGLLLQKILPVYPPIARAARVEGTVVLAAVISKNGVIENLRVVSGNSMLTQAALAAVAQWRYRPYMLNGEPVDVETTVNVVFTLGH